MQARRWRIWFPGTKLEDMMMMMEWLMSDVWREVGVEEKSGLKNNWLVEGGSSKKG